MSAFHGDTVILHNNYPFNGELLANTLICRLHPPVDRICILCEQFLEFLFFKMKRSGLSFDHARLFYVVLDLAQVEVKVRWPDT